MLAAAVAFVVTVALGSTFIRFLQSRKFGQFVREEGPQTHLIKAGTPTMGGVVMLMGLVAALLVVARLCGLLPTQPVLRLASVRCTASSISVFAVCCFVTQHISSTNHAEIQEIAIARRTI